MEDKTEYNINDFQRTYFKIISKNSNFYRVKTGIQSGTPKDILATGYLSKDLNVDIVLVDRNSQQLEFMLYDDKQKGEFKSGGTFDLKDKKEGEIIEAVHFAQIKEQKKDVLVLISKFKNSETQKTNYLMRGFSIESQKKDDLEIITLEDLEGYKLQFEPAVEDPGEPLNFQLFSETDSGSHDVTSFWLVMIDGKRKVVSYDESQKKMAVAQFEDFFDVSSPANKNSDSSNANSDFVDSAYFGKGMSFYYLDLNFDCRADIMVETMDVSGSKKYLEFYYFQGKNKPFKLIRQVTIGGEGESVLKYTSPRLVDLRQSNSLDLVFFNTTEKSLDIFLSKGPNPGDSSQEISTFCKASNGESTNFRFPDIDKNIELKKNTGYSYRLPLNDELYESTLDIRTLNFSFADLDMNGFPDLVMIVKEIGEDKSGNTEVKGKLKIFKNMECSQEEADKIYSGEDFKERCRKFDEESFETYNSQFYPVTLERFGFFDLGERGIIGLFLIDYTFGKCTFANERRRKHFHQHHSFPQFHQLGKLQLEGRGKVLPQFPGNHQRDQNAGQEDHQHGRVRSAFFNAVPQLAE